MVQIVPVGDAPQESRRSSVGQIIAERRISIANIFSQLSQSLGETLLAINAYHKTVETSHQTLDAFIATDLPKLKLIAGRCEVILKSALRCMERLQVASTIDAGDALLEKAFKAEKRKASRGPVADPNRIDLGQCAIASTLLKQLAHTLDSNARINQLPVAAGHDIVIIRIQLQRAGMELNSAVNEIKEAYAAHETRSHVFRRAREQSAKLQREHNLREKRFQGSIQDYLDKARPILANVVELQAKLTGLTINPAALSEGTIEEGSEGEESDEEAAGKCAADVPECGKQTLPSSKPPPKMELHVKNFNRRTSRISQMFRGFSRSVPPTSSTGQ